MSRNYRIAVIGGDGIGPFISKEAQTVLEYLLRDQVKSGKVEFRTIEGLTIENRAAHNKAIPDDVLEAARIDGAGPMRFFWDVLLPLSKTSIAALFVIQFIYGWNQYLWPQAVIDSDSSQTAQIRLRSIVGTDISDANVGIAAALLVAVPVVLLLIAFQRQIIRGLTAGAVKG